MTKFCPQCNKAVTSFWQYTSSIEDPTQTHMAACLCGWSGPVNLLLKEPSPPTPTPKLPYVSIDIETTGLDPDTCQVLEFGAVIEDWVRPVSQLPFFRRIFKYDKITGEPFALALNANLLKRISNPNEIRPIDLFCEPAELGAQFSAWLCHHDVDPKRVQAAGKNFASFDAQFLKRLPNFNIYIKFNHRTIDPTMLFWRMDDEGLPSSKTCMERAGIDGKVAHTAVEDAIAVIKMVRAGVQR
jgi:hypothetical protein